MGVVGFYLTTQSYRELKKDQPLQVLVMRAVKVRSHKRSKKLKYKNVSFAKKERSLEKI